MKVDAIIKRFPEQKAFLAAIGLGEGWGLIHSYAYDTEEGAIGAADEIAKKFDWELDWK